MRNPHAGVPFDTPDDQIAAALRDVSIPTLMLSMLHMTGDASIIDVPRDTLPVEDQMMLAGIADMALTNDPDGTLVTFALGSCIGVTIFDPVAKVGGMLHLMLPQASCNPEKAQKLPCMFADTGVPLLFKKAYELGATKERMVVCAAGGAEILADESNFKIGTRNRTIAGMILQQALGLGLIGFVVGKLAATLWAPVFPKYVLLLNSDALTGLGVTMAICALASTLAIRAALKVDPGTAIG